MLYLCSKIIDGTCKDMINKCLHAKLHAATFTCCLSACPYYNYRHAVCKGLTDKEAGAWELVLKLL